MTQRERLTVLIEECAAIHESGFDPDKRISAEALARYFLANGVLLPPMKIGQIIYDIDYDIDGVDVRELKVLKIVYFCDSYSMGCLRVGSVEETTKRNITVFDIEIGKHVFFTREEAEAELKKRRKEEKRE